MKRQLLRFINCPACRGDLRLEVTQMIQSEIKEGSLNCVGCHSVYPITRFIPRFVSSDLYVHSFSVEWNIFSRTQLDVGKGRDSLDTFTAKTGLKPDELAGCNVLEAGCGMGRFLEVVSRSARTTVIGFDLSLAVESAYANVGNKPNVHILQADIMTPPFRDGVFDFAFSLGVIHHTSNPKQAFMRLVPLVKKRGQVAIWVYHKYRRPPLSDLYRKVTKRMSWSMVLAGSKLLSKLYPIQKRCRYLLVLIPMSEEPDTDRRILDTYDWYSPWYQFKFTYGEVASWFRDAGITSYQCLDSPIAIRGTK